MNKKTDHQKNIEELDYQIRSRRPIIYICTHEEERIINVLLELANRPHLERKWKIHSWDLASGVKEIFKDISKKSTPQEIDQESVLKWFLDLNKDDGDKKETNILVLKDYQRLMGANGTGEIETMIVRQLRNMCTQFAFENKTIIIIGTSLYIPEDIEKNTFVIDWSLPEYIHIKELLQLAMTKASNSKIKDKFRLTYTENELDEIVHAFQGLTISEIELLIKYMFLVSVEFDVSIIASRKRDIIRKSGFVEWVENDIQIDQVGGLAGLKNWLNARKDSFSTDAHEYGLPEFPKGILLLGIPGTGKSLCAKAVADLWKLPLLKFDVGKIFSSSVGSSEANMRQAIKISESIAPCLLWVDEIDKGFSGLGSSNFSDGGTAARVFGSFYTWMQEKSSPVYVIATANEISNLPPELLRKGRFDEIFWVDLPDDEEREEIFKIHIKEKKRNAENFDLKLLSKYAKGYSGAEIATAISDGLHESYNDGKRALKNEDIVLALKNTIPLSKLMEEKLNAAREWSQNRTRSASKTKHKITNPITIEATDTFMDSIETLNTEEIIETPIVVSGDSLDRKQEL